MKKIGLLSLSMALFLLCAACGASGTGALKLVDSTAVQSGEALMVQSITTNQVLCDSGAEGYSFELHACHGRFYYMDSESLDVIYTTDYILEQSGEAHWMDSNINLESFPWRGEKTFIEVLIKQEGSYVGYAVVAMEQSEEQELVFTPVLIECKVLADDADRDGVTGATFQKLIEEAEEEYLSRKT